MLGGLRSVRLRPTCPEDRVPILHIRRPRLRYYGSRPQSGARKRTDDNRAHVVSRKARKNRASDTSHALCCPAQGGTKTGSVPACCIRKFSCPHMGPRQPPFLPRTETLGSHSNYIPPLLPVDSGNNKRRCARKRTRSVALFRYCSINAWRSRAVMRKCSPSIASPP